MRHLGGCRRITRQSSGHLIRSAATGRRVGRCRRAIHCLDGLRQVGQAGIPLSPQEPPLAGAPPQIESVAVPEARQPRQTLHRLRSEAPAQEGGDRLVAVLLETGADEVEPHAQLARPGEETTPEEGQNLRGHGQHHPLGVGRIDHPDQGAHDADQCPVPELAGRGHGRGHRVCGHVDRTEGEAAEHEVPVPGQAEHGVRVAADQPQQSRQAHTAH